MEGTEVTLIVGAVGAVTTAILQVANMINAYFREQRTRQWAIEDKLSLERHTKEVAEEVKAVAAANFKEVKETGEKRLETILAGQDAIVKKVDENTEVSVTAFKEANGVNAKLEKLGMQLTGDGQKVIIANTEPIAVHQK